MHSGGSKLNFFKEKIQAGHLFKLGNKSLCYFLNESPVGMVLSPSLDVVEGRHT